MAVTLLIILFSLDFDSMSRDIQKTGIAGHSREGIVRFVLLGMKKIEAGSSDSSALD